MRTVATFPAAPLADSITKASKIAPTKGAAFDKAAGIVITVSPGTDYCVIKSTDLDTTYLQHVPVLSVNGEHKVWRLPSSMISRLLPQLPMGEGSKIMFIDQEDSFMRLKAGSFMGKMRLIDTDSYPNLDWFKFDASEYGEANDFAKKAEQVSWAVNTSPGNILSGVHIDGEKLVACDSYCLALVPCPVPVQAPITVPLGQLPSLLKSATDVRLRADNSRLYLHLDAETQASSQLLVGAYPPVQNIARDTFSGKISFRKSDLIETLARLVVLVNTDKSPTLEVTLTLDKMRLDITSGDERFQDHVSAKAEMSIPSFTWKMSPQYLSNSVGGCRSDEVSIAFGPKSDLPLLVQDSKGYACWVMPKVVD